MNRCKGFTLIELVVVIVILGILAATAAPKFINLQDDAETATYRAIEAAMKSASDMVHGKALVANSLAATDTVKVNGADLQLVYGYPDADDNVWAALLDLDFNDFQIAVSNDGNSVIISDNSLIPAPQTVGVACTSYFTKATDTTLPVIESVPCQ